MNSHGVQPIADIPSAVESVMTELFERSGDFGLRREQIAAILVEVAKKYLPEGASTREIAEFCRGLRLEELHLARACAAGSERAWEIFMTRYRQKLYDIAAGIARESSAARELADSLYADLYGTTTRDGQRVSKLASYTGRGSLEGWLRTVMAQEFVNRYRRQKRLVSLDEESQDGVQFPAPATEAALAVDPRVEAAADAALAALPAEERYLLASYFLDGRTLADIARTLAVHESTISRKLDKLVKTLRKRIVSDLGRRGMSRRQAEEALEVDVRDLRVNIASNLAQESRAPTFPEKKAQAPAGEGSG